MARLAALAISLAAFSAHAAGAPTCGNWPAWTSYRAALMVEGRIVDDSDKRRITTSEGQSYGLFFALVANDRSSFDRLLTWTSRELAGGDLGGRLPAWLWGIGPSGQGAVLDANSASDADLWIAYTLGEAARLWHVPRYAALSRLMARRILRDESADLPGLGTTLLPAPTGFHPTTDSWRLNPSYLPLPILQRFAAQQPASAWPAILGTALRVVSETAPHGYSPDWARWQVGHGWVADLPSKDIGSYNAIRSYLWAGLAAPGDAAMGLRQALAPMVTLTDHRGTPPETVDARTGAVGPNDGPVGFSGALLPLMIAMGDDRGAALQRARIARSPPAPDAYYGRALLMFGVGAADGFYRFAPDGALLPRWRACPRPARP